MRGLETMLGIRTPYLSRLRNECDETRCNGQEDKRITEPGVKAMDHMHVLCRDLLGCFIPHDSMGRGQPAGFASAPMYRVHMNSRVSRWGVSVRGSPLRRFLVASLLENIQDGCS